MQEKIGIAITIVITIGVISMLVVWMDNLRQKMYKEIYKINDRDW